ncbi:MAG: single-stranded DNA-binding protein [Desulfobacterales bacterium]|nr:single-stranded DNA-binding protein [Desulfobacterales bacterium]
MSLEQITVELAAGLARLSFGPPVAHVYNPLDYARAPYREYLRRFGRRPRPAVLVGMNPGPWGMAQTGVPFGEIGAVRDWMGIQGPVGAPARPHPKRPVTGFACTRREVSGQRLWGWARKKFGAAEDFFERFFVVNYCPLLFITQSGANLTPDKLRAAEATPLFAVCDRALRRTIETLAPAHVVGIGRFAAERARRALGGLNVFVGAVTHPSPANPRANRGWEALIAGELKSMGIEV